MVGILAGLSVLLLFGGIYQVATFRRRKLDNVILHEESFRKRFNAQTEQTSRLFKQLAEKMEGFAPLVLSTSRRQKLENKLDQAGSKQTPEEIAGEQLTGLSIGVLFGSVGFLAGGLGILTLFFFGFAGWMRPQVALNKKWQERRKDIDDQLLSFVDVFSLMLETGASIYSGMEKAALAVSGPLGEEMNVMLRQSKTRGMTDALHQMSLRVDQPDLNGLVTILHQANKYGAGMDVVYSLRQFSFAVRTNKRNQIDQTVQKMSTKILFPMFFFILMPMMAILFAPVMMSFGQSGLL
ncbi:type II secretion system F family protein [Lentibacillus salinarum]|uniref:Type II secretion system F family protein n=1 Tax=Lentibacillus salinarum TaxID=446820 RepID=A0ABW3ZXF3_9BACI